MIKETEKELFNSYAELKLQIKRLEEQAEELNPQILEIMQTKELGEINVGEYGKLSIGSRRTWKYSSKVKELDEQLKKHKKEEEQTGLADYTEKHYILFNVKKDDNLRTS